MDNIDNRNSKVGRDQIFGKKINVDNSEHTHTHTYIHSEIEGDNDEGDADFQDPIVQERGYRLLLILLILFFLFSILLPYVISQLDDSEVESQNKEPILNMNHYRPEMGWKDNTMRIHASLTSYKFKLKRQLNKFDEDNKEVAITREKIGNAYIWYEDYSNALHYYKQSFKYNPNKGLEKKQTSLIDILKRKKISKYLYRKIILV